MAFDNKTIELLDNYVYALFHPDEDIPFYIGKGVGNRVFNHMNHAIKSNDSSLKLDKIRGILDAKKAVKHIILRHGLSSDKAISIESTLIDLGNYIGWNLSNKVDGHHANFKGLMTTDEIIRKHNAKPLERLEHPAVIININKKYKRGKSSKGIYEATKEAWVIGKFRRDTVKYALAEYAGIIIEVFEIMEWYPIHIPEAKRKNRWGFNGVIASEEVRSIYINKSVAHTKAPGASNPIKYVLRDYSTIILK